MPGPYPVPPQAGYPPQAPPQGYAPVGYYPQPGVPTTGHPVYGEVPPDQVNQPYNQPQKSV